jgi:hypothetical protein
MVFQPPRPDYTGRRKKQHKKDFSQVALDVVRKATEEENPLQPPKGMFHALASAPTEKLSGVTNSDNLGRNLQVIAHKQFVIVLWPGLHFFRRICLHFQLGGKMAGGF